MHILFPSFMCAVPSPELGSSVVGGARVLAVAIGAPWGADVDPHLPGLGVGLGLASARGHGHGHMHAMLSLPFPHQKGE